MGQRLGDDPVIACTLTADDVPARLEAWAAALDRVTARTAVDRTGADTTLRLSFADGVEVAALAGLVAAEQRCCSFFRFAITVDERGVGLEVGAPADAASITAGLFGDPD